MGNEKKSSGAPDGPVEVAGLRRNGKWVVLLRTRVNGKIEEFVLRESESRLVVADRLQQAMLDAFRGQP